MFRTIVAIVGVASLGAVLAFPEDRSRGDPIRSFSASDRTMNEAQAEARGHLTKFFAAALDEEDVSTYGSLVKVAFPVTHNGEERTEIIWVGPFRALGADAFAGALANEPNYMPNVAAGDEVQFSTDMIRDWMLPDGNGRAYGHFTTRVIASTSSNPQYVSMVREMVTPNPVPDSW